MVEDPTGCPVFVARTVTGFDPTAPTPDFIAQRLTAAGMRPISLAVDVTNYVMLEPGRPIHGYDADRLQGPIVVRRARAGERLTTLDGTARTLSDEDLVVTDDSGIIGLGGVMGGESTEMSATTTRVLVEAAHWDATSMFRTGRRHKITSEAGKRNERGVDPTICEAAADRVVELLAEYGGGQVDPGVTVVGTPPPMPTITVAGDRAARVSGLDISEERAVEALRAVGCEVSGSGTLEVTPPPWRSRPHRPPGHSPRRSSASSATTPSPRCCPRPRGGRGLTRTQLLRRRIGRTMAGAGYVEVVTFPFVGDDRPRRPRAPGRRPAPHHPAPLQPAQQRGAGHDDDPAARAAAHGRQERRARHDLGRDLRGRARHAAPGHGAGADPAGRPAARPTPSSTR